MKVKAKIVQIIKEEENENYGIPKIPNTDWLNIRPIPEFKRKGSAIFLGLFILGFVIVFLFNTFLKTSNWVALLAGVISWLFGIYFLYKESRENEKIFPGGIWPLEAPFPVEKPHDYKVNDEVEINVELSKCQKLA